MLKSSRPTVSAPIIAYRVIAGITQAVALVALAGLSTRPTRAELRPENVHVADSKKNQSYIRDGLITGGDKAIDEVVVKEIRRASNPGYERVVIDLEGNHNGEPAAIPRPAYYQVAVTPDEQRIVFTIWGNPRLSFDSRRVVNAFKHSSVIEGVTLLPKVEDKSWSFVFELKGDSPVEVFELSNPVRIIMDIKKPSGLASPSKSPAHKKAQASAKPAKKSHAASTPESAPQGAPQSAKEEEDTP